MRKSLLIIFFIVLLFEIKAQLVVNTGALTPTQYVEDVLIGSGITVSNVTFTGDTNQLGEFDANATIPFLGMTDGLLMATGDVNVAVGPNDTSAATIMIANNPGGDIDLNTITGFPTYDAAVLEFDFVSMGDTIVCSFILASEEYPEYVNSINDGFGVFLSGPAISGSFNNGAENIALIPGTTDAISINNINSTANSSYYVDNTFNTGMTSVQFDGYSTAITIKAAVQIGFTYHVKIAIGDAYDDIIDSGVFIKLKSFKALNIIPTEIDENLIYNSVFSIMPNPSNGIFYYKSIKEINKPLTISLNDLSGREVYNEIVRTIKTNSKERLDLSHLRKGIYFLKFKTDSTEFVEKVIIK